MHSYIYQNKETIKDLVVNSLIISLEITSLDDVKKLHHDLKLSQRQKTSLILTNADTFSSEIYNALLKTLEEPNDNLSFFLEVQNTNYLPPTILSRCQILKTQCHPQPSWTPDQVRGDNICRIQKRNEALELLTSLTHYYHSLLVKGNNLKKVATNLSLTDTAYQNIKKNGHLLLNLVNLTINLKRLNQTINLKSV